MEKQDFVRQSVGLATKGKTVKTWKCDLLDPFISSYIFLIISNSFASYGCHYSFFSLETCTLLKKLVSQNLVLVQGVLASEGISLEFRHIVSYLLWYSQCHNHTPLLNLVGLQIFATRENFQIGNI